VPAPASATFLRKRSSISFGATTSAPNSYTGSDHRRDSQFDQDSTMPYPLLGDSPEADAVLKSAITAFKINLHLDEDSLLQDVIHLRDIPAGAFLAKEDSHQVS